MNTKCLLPLAFFALFISNVFAQACPPRTLKSQGCDLVIDSLVIKPLNTQGFEGCSGVEAFISDGTPPYVTIGTPDVHESENYIACTQGQHCIIVTDLVGCTVSSCFTYEPCTMVLSPLTVDSIVFVEYFPGDCAFFTAEISGGIPPYSLDWGPDNSSSDTDGYIACSEGDHCLIVTDAAGCTFSHCFEYEIDTTNVFEISSIELTTPQICAGDCGVAYVIISDNSPPYDYTLQWSDGMTPSGNGFEYCSGGIYTVTATDTEGNVAIDSFEVVQFPEVFAEVTTTDVSCHGAWDGSIMVHGSGGVAPYEYSWYLSLSNEQSLSNVMPGQHYGYVTDTNGCQSELALGIVNEPPLLEISVEGDEEGGAMAFASGGTSPHEFQWNDPNNQTTQTATNLGEGQFTVTVTDANGCTNTETIDLTVGIETPEFLTNFNVSPNPSNGKFMIDLQFEVTQTATIQILNSLGQKMYQFTDIQSHFTQTIDMNEAAAGTYFVIISTESGRIVRRIVLM